jgi:2-methyl-3-hydroxypyridine 5-carboxylic acid dioxygenase
MHIQVAGAGIAGLASAAGFGKSGWNVEVHEAAPELRPTGGGLYMSKYGLDALRSLGILESFLERAFRPKSFETWVDGALRGRYVNTGHFYTALRQDLHDLLVGTCKDNGVQISTGSRVTGVDPSGGLRFEDGSFVNSDLVIAADGVGSQAHSDLGFERNVVFHKDGLIRVLIDRDGLPGDGWDSSQDIWSYRDDPLRILYTPCSPTHCYLVMMAPVSDRARLTLPMEPLLWRPRFPSLAPLLDRVPDQVRIDRYSTIRMASWHRRRAAIVGDAAHAMPSSHGKGANLALFSASRLVHNVANYAEPVEGLQAWEAEMRPVITDAQAEAEHIASSRSLSGGLPERDLDSLVPASLRHG